MEDQKKSNNLVSNIWRNWCQLDPQQRSQVASKLGPVGHMLSIAANVTRFAQNGAEIISDNQASSQESSQSQQSQTSRASGTRDEGEDVIDAEFEECEP